MYWYWINVYNNEEFLGSFYTQNNKPHEWVSEILSRYGNYTRYTAE